MSTSSINLSSSTSSHGSLLQITGLASGLDTNSIISALLAIDKQPITSLANQQNGLKALNSQLTNIQTALQTVATNAQALGDPGLWSSSQTVTSSDSTRVSGTTSTGAGVGGYQVAITQLANSSQRTFTYTSPAADESVTIDGSYSTTIKAGTSIDDFVSQINSDPNAPVYAAKTGTGTVVMSERATGAPTGGQFIVIGGDTENVLAEQTSLARAGQDANYSIDGGATQTSSSNTVTGAIAGVTLSLNALTTTSGPVTINVGAPGPNSSSIQAAVKTFVDSYNSTIDQVNSELTTKPDKNDPTVGTLFGDSELTDLLGNMRQGIYSPQTGLSGITSLADIGISTGAASGSATFSQNAVDGKLTIDSTALANAIQNNPNGVRQMLQSWSSSFSTIVNNEVQPGGSIDARIQGDTAQISDMSDQINNLNSILADRQTALQAQFASLEATLSQNQSQSSWLASQINALPIL